MKDTKEDVLDVQAFVDSFIFAILEKVTDPNEAYVRLDKTLADHVHRVVGFSDDERREIVMLLNHEILEVFGFDLIAEVQLMKGD